MNAKDRLLEFLKYLNIGQNKFEAFVGISNGYINNNKGSIGTAIITKIATKYPELNIAWLQTGKGEMLKKTPAFLMLKIQVLAFLTLNQLRHFVGRDKGLILQ